MTTATLTPTPTAPVAPPASGPLAVFVSPLETVPRAAAALRRGPAVALVADDDQLMPAITEAARAGFDVRAAETLRPRELRARLRRLPGEERGCVVVPAGAARELRRILHAAARPVLVVPPGSRPAADAPAVVDAHDVHATAGPAAAVLASGHAIVVAAFDPVDTGTLVRTAAHPLLVPRLHELAELRRWDELDRAESHGALAAVLATEHGLAADVVVAPEPHGVVRTAADRGGIVLVADPGGRRVPPLLRAALREGRPALIVPALP